MGIRRALVVLVAAVLLGGCAGTDDSSGGDAVSPSPSSSLPEDLPTPTPSGKPSAGASIEISGTIVQGVEPGCRLIDQYLLISGPGVSRDDLPIGATLTVRGRVEQGMMTTCQQGTPFVVTEIMSR
ncbi:hypothetical protein RB614_00120 [Phytohabitans sp. ZYX-F-186]|uniref:Lipoprotein n=1 Tax=Phytohabitans maris TaxID=3071409 RepID=A0ABU0Z790_9ACTN|nr:hypothetical protein [Phytohabitans sp. ZYX-F-186]MDQ7902925.1 hypothetical protein [Phytohabitans sp. ZYX-F-186]